MPAIRLRHLRALSAVLIVLGLSSAAQGRAELGRVDALHQCVDAIAPALAGFVNALNDEQNAQLNAMLGVAPQPERAAR